MSSACQDHGRKGYGLGYATAWVRRNGQRLSTTLHRKVYWRATGDWPEVVRHTCDNPRCINPEHLLGGTQLDNVRDCAERGRTGDQRNFGAANGRCILTETSVARIRAEYVKGSREFGLPALARKHGCSVSQVYRIVTGEQRA